MLNPSELEYCQSLMSNKTYDQPIDGINVLKLIKLQLQDSPHQRPPTSRVLVEQLQPRKNTVKLENAIQLHTKYKRKSEKDSDADDTKKNCRRGPKSKWNVGTSNRPKLSVIRHKVKCVEQTQSPINAKRFLTMILFVCSFI